MIGRDFAQQPAQHQEATPLEVLKGILLMGGVLMFIALAFRADPANHASRPEEPEHQEMALEQDRRADHLDSASERMEIRYRPGVASPLEDRPEIPEVGR